MLPVSLSEFKKIFIGDNAPYSDDKFLASLGNGVNTILSVDKWMPIPSDASDYMKSVFG